MPGDQQAAMDPSESTTRSPRHLSRPRAVLLAGIAAALLFASALDVSPLRDHLLMRALLLFGGLVPAGWLLFSLLPHGCIDESNRRRFVLAIFGLHLAATLYVFPPGAIFDRRPFVTVDHAVHYAQCVRAKSVFWRSLKMSSYSPYFMAGYPAGTVFDVDMKGAELFCTVLPFPTALTLKAFILGAYLSIVFTLLAGARLLGFRLEESAVGVLVFLVYWHWGRPYAGAFRFVGMFSFVFASHLCLLLTGLLRRFLLGTNRRTFFVLAPLTFLVHISALVIAAAPLVTVLLTDRLRLRRRNVEVLLMCALLVLFVNVLWLKPVIDFLPEKTPTKVYYQTHGMVALLELLARPSAVLGLALLALAVLGSWRLAREGRLRVGAPCVAGTLFLLLCASYGVYVPGLDQMEPGRFLLSALVFAAPLAGAGAAWLLDAALAPGVGPAASARRVRMRAAAIVALALASLPLALVEAKAYYRHTVRVSFSAGVDALRAAIDAHVAPGARLMIEDASAETYGGTHLPALLPLHTGVEQIGGPYPHTPLRHYRTSFTSDAILGTPLAGWKPEELRARLSFLRVRWIVTATPATTAVIASLHGVTRVWEHSEYSLWELPDAGPWEPRVVSAFNRLDVDFSASSKGVVIPYHWVHGLKATAPADIVPVLRYDDPVPYIYVRPRGLSHVVIAY
jgi:hypothetical protein